MIPHLATYLLQRLNIVDHFRHNQVPTGRDLSAILTYSWDLWTLETDLLKSPHAKRAAIVDKALDVYHRGVEAVVTTAEPIFLDPTVEAFYQQLLHAAASTAFDTGDFLRAKALYEAHLATSPATTDFKMRNLIRRKQLQSLIEWHMCVYIIARCMGDVDDKAMRGLMRSFLDMIEDSGKPGGLPKALAKVMKEHSEEFGKKRVRDDVASFGLQREPETVKKFGWFARRLLEEPLYVVYADAFDKEVRDLNKWWNLHQGQEISKRSQCCALIDFMT